MSRVIAALVACLLVILTGMTVAQDNTTASETRTYVIQPGDTLFSIARRFNTSVSALAQENGIVNPAHIFWGQRLRIPGEQPQPPAEQPVPTPPPAPATDNTPTVYVVRRGDTLNRIALQHSLTVAELLAANPDIRNANLLYAGQRINIPNPAASDSSPSETTGAVTLTDTAETTPIATVDFGLQANLLDQNTATLMTDIDTLGVRWVEQVVNWREFEPVAGEINFGPLDSLIDSLQAQNLQILLTVTAAPDWARSIQEENGPPDNFEDYATFVSALASRYAGRVAAYEIWDEPNLRSRWKSKIHPISAASYIELLRLARDAIKTADPDALVISGGLAPTGFNDALNAAVGNLEVNAVDDRIFLSGMYAGGLAGLVDAVGAHPMGWANPPDAVCCDQPEGVETHYDDPHFYFLNTLRDYRQIQLASGDETTPIWVTKFGWGTSEDIGTTDPINVFTAYTSLEEQAQYTVRAFAIGASLGYVGPMFVFNLNGCQAPGDEGPSSCYYSLLGPDGTPRPIFSALQNLETQPVEENSVGEPVEANTPETTSAESAEMTPEVSPGPESTSQATTPDSP